MKRLIINADDLGADEGRNEGIFEVMRAGVVTSASLLPNSPALGHALAIIRQGGFEGVSFGIHLNLTEGRPLSDLPKPLAGADGGFLGKAAAHRLLQEKADSALEAAVAREADRQVAVLMQTGLPLSHIDGHQHVHVFPAVWDAAVSAAQRHGIRWIRIPDEPVDDGSGIPRSLVEEARFFGDLGKSARERLAGTGLKASAHFRGMHLKGRLSVETLLAAIEQLPDGLTELMVHPGRLTSGSGRGPFAGFSVADREREIEALLDPAIRRALGKSGVVLTNYGEVDR
ncbi:MAG TPA: ChbG/HpnK family deacetylase [Syntrophales bacterium]|nr:ChbG/HpnK family deacetylase [Syntrophales bacterium]